MKRVLRDALAILAITLILITGTPVVMWVTRALAVPWGREDAPVLVVLGGDMLIPGTGSDATLGFTTYLRCVMASSLARQHHYRYILVTGGGGLAQSMQQFLLAQGIDKRCILREEAAKSTYENAVFSKRILSSIYGAQLPRVVVLTSDFHSRRALLTFRQAGYDASCIPAPDIIKRSSTRSYRLQATQTLAIELIALASYELRGYV